MAAAPELGFRNSGTMQFPVATLEHAVELAKTVPLKHDVYVAQGKYELRAPLRLPPHVSLFGQFDGTTHWGIAARNVTTISGPATTLILGEYPGEVLLGLPVRLVGLKIIAADAKESGESSKAVVIRDSKYIVPDAVHACGGDSLTLAVVGAQVHAVGKRDAGNFLPEPVAFAVDEGAVEHGLGDHPATRNDLTLRGHDRRLDSDMIEPFVREGSPSVNLHAIAVHVALLEVAHRRIDFSATTGNAQQPESVLLQDWGDFLSSHPIERLNQLDTHGTKLNEAVDSLLESLRLEGIAVARNRLLTRTHRS